VARALAEHPKVILLDEPTEHLQAPAVEELFRLIGGMVAQGGAVVYISHRLHEVKRIADRVSVLRDGAMIGTFNGDDVTEQDVINLVVGREIQLRRTRAAGRNTNIGDVLLEVDGLSGDHFSDIALSARAGEIVGFAGIEGQGQREVLRALGGLERNRGIIRVAGKTVRTSSPVSALADGVAYLPPDRHKEGILPGLNLRENASLAAIASFARGSVIQRRREQAAVARQFEALRVKAPSQAADISTLSGGNQQKVVLSRVLLTGAPVVLADEPTQGVDVGAREEIYEILREQARSGAAVVILSSSAAELDQICDRVIVFSRGRAVKELVGDDVSEHAIAHAALTSTAGLDRKAKSSRGVTLRRRLARSDRVPGAVLAVLTVLLAIVAAQHTPFYLTTRNFGLVLPLLGVLAFYAIAQQLVMLVGGIDLSVGPLGGTLVVVGSFVLAAYRSPAGMVLGVLVLVLVAAGVGLVNWALITILKISPLIATLVTYTALQGFASFLRPTPGGVIDPGFTGAVSTKFGFVPLMIIAAVVVAVALEVLMRRNLLGLRLRAVGSQRVNAQRVGVRANVVTLCAYVGCSVLVVPAALLLMAQAGTGNAAIGDSYTLASIGAAVLGGASIFGGRGSFVGALFGAVLVTQINTVVQFLGVELYWQQWLLGGLTILAAAFYSKTRSLADRS
jgi:ribose transport system ATP-binding protein